ncbi:MAG: prefoldin subunit alpha [Candidatus Altiarchaeales archaeon ex4484_43]|nr:MAG: prefoldin subunit alpha [Candidatus Altiarchaeales archaeon ex4484_43]
MKADKQRELQRILIEADNYKKQIDSLSAQIQIVENKRMEMDSTIETMDSLKENKIGTEILVPIGSNSFVRAELRDNKKIIVGIGAGISVEKTIDEAKEILKSRNKELEDTMNKLQSAIIGIKNELLELDSTSKKLIQELQMTQNVPVTEEETR